MGVLRLRQRPVLLALGAPDPQRALGDVRDEAPVGEGLGSITGPGTGSARAVPARSSATYTLPDRANAASSAAASTA